MAIYLRKAVECHEATNCLSDIIFEDALAIPTFTNIVCSPPPGAEDVDRKAVLLGVPISIKGRCLSIVPP